MLIDFMAKLMPAPETEEKPKEKYNVWADEDSSSTGVGIGIVLEGPHKANPKCVAKLAF